MTAAISTVQIFILDPKIKGNLTLKTTLLALPQKKTNVIFQFHYLAFKGLLFCSSCVISLSFILKTRGFDGEEGDGRSGGLSWCPLEMSTKALD